MSPRTALETLRMALNVEPSREVDRAALWHGRDALSTIEAELTKMRDAHFESESLRTMESDAHRRVEERLRAERDHLRDELARLTSEEPTDE